MSQEAIGGVSQEAQDMQTEFWQKTLNDINKMSGVCIAKTIYNLFKKII